jgi:hypothetical protein
MIFRITPEERKLIVDALRMLSQEYRTLSESNISAYLRDGFEQDANLIRTLADRATVLSEQLTTTVMNAEALSLMQGGYKIDAIKLVRANAILGLKEAKDYVEKLEREAV